MHVREKVRVLCFLLVSELWSEVTRLNSYNQHGLCFFQTANTLYYCHDPEWISQNNLVTADLVCKILSKSKLVTTTNSNGNLVGHHAEYEYNKNALNLTTRHCDDMQSPRAVPILKGKSTHYAKYHAVPLLPLLRHSIVFQ